MIPPAQPMMHWLQTTTPRATVPTAQPTMAQWATAQTRPAQHTTPVMTPVMVPQNTTPEAVHTTSISTTALQPAADTTVSELIKVAPIAIATLTGMTTDPPVFTGSTTIPTPVPVTIATTTDRDHWKEMRWALTQACI